MAYNIKGMWMKKVICAAMLVTSLTGCASIMNGTTQVVSLETRNKGEVISGVACKLENSKGTFFVTSPGTVTVNKAYGDLIVKCEKESYEAGLAAVRSTMTPMFLGNIIFGGIVGMGIDAASGAGFDYPTLLTVSLGESVKLGGTVVAANTASAPVAGGNTPAAPVAVGNTLQDKK